MPITDLLTSGQTPTTSPTSQTTEKVLPDWYTNYAMNILSGQQAVSSNPLQMYQGPRVAPLTALQQQGMDQTASSAQAFQPDLTAATNTTTGALGISPSAAAQPYMDAAAAPATANVSNYMNPYMSSVVDQIAQAGNRNFSENLMPQISDQFVKAGGYGGSRNAMELGRAARDTQTAITNAQGQALNTGFNSALGAAQTDAARQATLANTAGALGASDANIQFTGAGQLASQGAQQQALGLNGASALMTAGGVQQTQDQNNMNTAYQDFLTQQGYPQAQITKMISALQGVQPAVPSGTQTQGTSVAGYTPSTAASILGVLGALGSPTVQSGISGIGGALSSLLGGGSSTDTSSAPLDALAGLY